MIDEAITQAMLDSGASKTFVNSRRGLHLTGRSDKVVVTAGGTKLQATNTGLLSTRALSKGAREAIIVPGMSQPALMSVSTLANNGYTTVFLPGNDGVNVFRANNMSSFPQRSRRPSKGGETKGDFGWSQSLMTRPNSLLVLTSQRQQ